MALRHFVEPLLGTTVAIVVARTITQRKRVTRYLPIKMC